MLREGDDGLNELADVAGRTQHRALVASRGAPAAASSGVRDGDSTCPICSRSLATIPPPSAMYSNTLVGDPKNLLSIMWALCGET